MFFFLHFISLPIAILAATLSLDKTEPVYEASATNSHIEQSQDWKRYGFKTAIVKIKSREDMTGVEIIKEIILYIMDYGMIEAREVKETRHIKMINRVETTEYRTIMDKDVLVTIRDGKTHKMKNPAGDLMKSLTDQKANQFAGGITDALNAETNKIGEEPILDFLCDIYESKSEIMGMKLYVKEWKYKDFAFKTISKSLQGETLEEVISFEENVAIPPEKIQY